MKIEVSYEKVSLLQAMLFISGDNGLMLSEIMDGLREPKAQTHRIIKALTKKLEDDNQSGIIVYFYNHRYHLTSKSEHAKILNKVFNVKTNLSLSQASLEALAIVAYYGPVTRSTVDKFRGINSDGVIHNLKEKELILSVGKAKSWGKPHLYNVSQHFYQIFKINSIKDLPDISDKQQDEKNIGNLFKT